MVDAYAQVQPDSTGKKVQTFENTVGANVVEAQAVVLVNTAGGAITEFPVSMAEVPVGAALDASVLATNTKLGDGSSLVGLTDGATDAAGTMSRVVVRKPRNAAGPDDFHLPVTESSAVEMLQLLRSIEWEAKKQTGVLILIARSFGHHLSQDDVNALTTGQ